MAGFLERGLHAETAIGLEFDRAPTEGFNALHDTQGFRAKIFHGEIIVLCAVPRGR